MDETVNYGNDRLVAGKGMEKSDEVIVVEGRADVLNLLRNDIDNVVAIGGAKITPTIVELTKKKDVTVFLDGDRGGDIILNELVSAGAEIDFVSRAPAGTEVEELTRKELIKALRNKIPFGQYFNEKDMSSIISKRQNEEQRHPQQSFSQRMNSNPSQQQHQSRPYYQPQHQQPRQERPLPFDRNSNSEEKQKEHKENALKEAELQQMEFAKSLISEAPAEKKIEAAAKPPERVERAQERPERILEKPERSPDRVMEKPAEPIVPKEKVDVSTGSFISELNKMAGQSKAKIYNEKGELVTETYVRDMIKALDESREPHAIVFDGIVTQRLVDIASQKGTKFIVGLRAGNVRRVPETLSMVTLQ
jgi:DNA primase